MLPVALEYPRGIEMVSVCTVPARGGRSCEHFGGYKTINRIPLPFIYIYTRKVPVLRTVATKFPFTSKISGHPDILATTHLGLPYLWINNARGLVNIYAIDR